MATLVSELELPYLDAGEIESREERLAALATARDTHWLARSPLGYAITRHEDVTSLLRDRRWHSAVRLIRQMNGMPPEEGERESILSAEGDVHSRLRRLVAPAFSPKAADKLRPFMRTVIGELIDRIAIAGTRNSSPTSVSHTRFRSSVSCSVRRRRTGGSSAAGPPTS